MFELAQKICYPGSPNHANEDIVGYGKDYFFVMDGASCLSGIHVMGNGSDAAWMVQQVKQELCQMLDNGDPRETKEILRGIIARVRSEYLDMLLQNQVAQAPDDSPSAGLALFRERSGKLEFFGLGDCVGVATIPNRGSFASLDTNLPNLDNAVLEQMMQLHLQIGIPLLETRSQCTDLLIANRCKRNHPSGYWILDLISDDGLDNAREFSWELSGEIRAGGFSDGFAQLAETFHFYDGYSDLFAAMQANDLNKLYDTLYQAQAADPDCNDYPRLKLRDDTCAIWGTFKN